MARSSFCCDKDWKKWSNGMRIPPRGIGSVRTNRSPSSSIYVFGGNHVYVVRLDHLTGLGLHDRHARVAIEQLRHHALVVRIQMLDQDVGNTRIGGCGLQESAKCLETAGRSADSDDHAPVVSSLRAGRRRLRLAGTRSRRPPDLPRVCCRTSEVPYGSPPRVLLALEADSTTLFDRKSYEKMKIAARSAGSARKR